MLLHPRPGQPLVVAPSDLILPDIVTSQLRRVIDPKRTAKWNCHFLVIAEINTLFAYQLSASNYNHFNKEGDEFFLSLFAFQCGKASFSYTINSIFWKQKKLHVLCIYFTGYALEQCWALEVWTSSWYASLPVWMPPALDLKQYVPMIGISLQTS